MQFEIVDDPFQVMLVGFRGAIGGECPGTVGKGLMDRLWSEVQSQGLKTKGINHWVYLEQGEMFTGVELAGALPADVGELETLDVRLGRRAQQLHVGPYTELAQLWPALMKELATRGEHSKCPHLEIYGHCNSNPMLCETMIVIGL